MPLHDSFKKRTQTNIVKLSSMPTVEDLAFAMSQVLKVAGEPRTFEWMVGDSVRVLNIVRGFGENAGGATWVLKSGQAFEAEEIWRYSTSDVQTIYTLIAEESSPASLQAAVIPEALRPQPERKEEELSADENRTADKQDESIPGSFFAERYEIIETIGNGASGAVYKAKQRFIDRFVALKILHRHLIADSVSKKRFEQEAKAASSLNHPNLIIIYDFGFSMSGRPFIAMEYVEGSSLDFLLRQKKLLNTTMFYKIFSQCCLALSHAHHRTVIHRDLKPSNIVLSQSESGEPIVKVVDFGLAKILARDEKEQELTQSGNVMGSPYFMSPEQCQGATLDARTDIYSLGCVMYYAISGVLPFAGKDIMHTLYKHVNEDAAPLLAARPDLNIPKELDKIVLKALARDLTKRYASVDEILADLDAMAANLIQAESAPVPAAPQVVPALHEVDTVPEQNAVVTLADLLSQAGIIADEDVAEAQTMAGTLGGEVVAVMVANQMLEYYLFDAVNRCRDLMQKGDLSKAQAIMLLRYCAVSKAEFAKAVKDLGWSLPD